MANKKKWLIKEKSCLSLFALNKFIEENEIQPQQIIKYDTTFEQMKQCTKYILTYWQEIVDKKEQ